MKFAWLLVALYATLCLSQDTVLTAERAYGIDYIQVDTPSFPTQLFHSYSKQQVYIVGQDYIRLAHTADDFAMEADPGLYNVPYISAYPFYNSTNYNALFVAGIAPYSQYITPNVGFSTDVVLEIPNAQGQKGGYIATNFPGYAFYNLYVDSSDYTDVLAYLVGYRYNASNPDYEIDFVVVRAHYNGMTSGGQFNKKWTFDPVNDVSAPLYSNSYAAYSSTYKPWIDFHSYTQTITVVDPNTGFMWQIQTSGPTNPLGNVRSDQIVPPYSPPLNDNLTLITSVEFGKHTNKTYIGYAGQGINGGGIAVVDTNSLNWIAGVQFPAYFSNPRALMLDEEEGALYVGFKGLQPSLTSGISGNGLIMKLDYLSLETTAQQNIPYFASNIESGKVGGGHVYFVTHDQHAILARVAKTDFCSYSCPSFPGFCSNGFCACGDGAEPSADGLFCTAPSASSAEACDSTVVEQKKEIKSEHGAVAALAVFFVLSFLAAVAGWAMWYRARYGAYNAV